MDTKRLESALRAVEEAVGHKAEVAPYENGEFQFRVASDENVEDTNGRGKFRKAIREAFLSAGAAEVKVSLVASLWHPERHSVYAVTALDEEKTFLAGR